MNKNKRGEMNLIGMFIIVAVTLIVGLVCFQVIAQQVGDSTSTKAYGNTSLAVVVNGTPQYITTCKALSDVIVYNATDAAGFAANGSAIESGNYTFTDNVIYNGALSVKVDPTASNAPFVKTAWKVQGTCQEPDYISDAGGRAMASLIIVMFALAILVVALSPTLRGDLMDMVR
jgi:heme/copper-type cytochrome/quinol oxidase subunit 2